MNEYNITHGNRRMYNTPNAQTVQSKVLSKHGAISSPAEVGFRQSPNFVRAFDFGTF
ncbi:unnamed protein product [Sphenostylis stenocarpa]|uniref:Uncharacterized protein n=1 Tax=Sphenostylis stenocarpa TaxID=92480 RepID=A0AA86VFU8_9FABA|nr:unnamed protein product [Sphenostylis stenocarpa]